MATWTNDDGLTIKSGVTEAVNSKVGEFNNYGGKHVLELDLRFENLPAVADNSVTVSDSFRIPAGAFIEAVEIVSVIDFVGSGATLNVGITDADGGTTIQDVDALVVEATIGELNVANTDLSINASGWVGTRVRGVPLEEAVLLTWEVNTAAITAGKGYIRVTYSVPNPAADTLGT